MGEIDYLDLKFRNQELHQKQWQKYEDKANELFLKLSRLFITLAVGLFTFTSPVFQNICVFTSPMKTLVFIGWVFLLISITAGVVQIIVEKLFFKRQAKYYSFISVLYAMTEPTLDGLEKVDEEKQKETIKNFENSSSLVAFYIQVFSFGCATIFFLIVFYKMLFVTDYFLMFC